jgi:hypothetical protein
MHKTIQATFLAAGLLLSAAPLHAQQPPKALTNDDIVAMVKNSLPEDVIVNAVQANTCDFDISANGLIALKKENVSSKLINAMLAAATAKNNPQSKAGGPGGQSPQAPQGQQPALPPGNPLGSLANAGSGQGLAGFMSAMKAAFGGGMPGAGGTTASGFGVTVPTVAVLDAGVRKELAYERTFLAQAKSTSNSLTEIAKDSAMRSALDAGLNQTVSSTSSYLGSSIGGSIAGNVIGETSNSVMASIIARHRATETFVWAVSGTTSSNVVSSNSPSLEVNYANLAGVNPDEFEPTIVKLSPSQGSFRLVGATKQKTDPNRLALPEWEIYSSFIEDRVAARIKKVAPGDAQVSPSSPLAAGEYAIVLRPLSKDKKFSGADVSLNRGDGLLFNSAWSFTVK